MKNGSQLLPVGGENWNSKGKKKKKKKLVNEDKDSLKHEGVRNGNHHLPLTEQWQENL